MWTVLWATGGASVANIALNFILIPIWGLEGAATALTMAGSSMFLFFKVRKKLEIPIKFAGFI